MKYKQKRNYLGDILLSLTVLSQFFLGAFQIFLLHSGIASDTWVSGMRLIGSVVFVFLSIRYVLKRQMLLFLVSYGLVLCLFSLSVLQNQEHFEYISTEGFRFTVCICIPIFLSFISIRDFGIFLHISLWVSLAMAIMGILYMYFFLTGKLLLNEGFYSMSFGYSMLFPVLFLLYTRKTVFAFVALILSIVILLLGSRGPLITIVLFVIFQKIFLSKRKDKVYFLIIGAFLLFFLFPIFIEYVSLQNIESRTLNLLLSGETISHDSGRNLLYNIAIKKIVDNPFWGYGVFADRIYCGGIYCHNLFLELFIDFGCVIPILIILFALLKFIHLYRHLDIEELQLVLLFSLLAIIPLLVSGSYLIDFRFSLFMGYMYILFQKYSRYSRKYLLLRGG